MMDPGVSRPTLRCGEGDLAGCSHATIARQQRKATRRIRCEFYAFVINEGRTQKAEGRKQKAEGRTLAICHWLTSAFCFLPSAFRLRRPTMDEEVERNGNGSEDDEQFEQMIIENSILLHS